MSKKVLVIVGAIIIVAVIAILAIVMSGSNNNNQLVDEYGNPITQAPGDWQTYNAPNFGYSFNAPTTWFMSDEQNGYRIYLSNNEKLESITPGNVTLEINGLMTKPANTDLAAYIKTTASRNGDPGAITEMKTSNGVRVVAVEHSGGKTTDGPGYAIEKTATEFIYVIVAGDATDQKIPEIISSFQIF